MLNHHFKVIFNRSTGCFTAVAEYARGRGKSKSLHTARTDTCSVVDGGSLRLKALVAALLLAGAGFSQQAVAADINNVSAGASSGAGSLAGGAGATTGTAKGATAIGSDGYVSVPGAGASEVAAYTNSNEAVQVTLDGKRYKMISGNKVYQYPTYTTAAATATGHSSVAVGAGARALRNASTAMGAGASAVGSNTVAIGFAASASSNNTVAIGYAATASGNNAIAVGKSASASARSATALGQKSLAAGAVSVAVGQKSSAVSTQAVALGSLAVAGKVEAGVDASRQSIAVGYKAQSEGDQAIAVGANTNASGNSSIAIGGDDLDRVATKGPKKPQTQMTYDDAKDANDTDAADKYNKLTGDILVHYENNSASPAKPSYPDRYTETTSGAGAVAVGVSSTAGDLATSFGTRANALGTASLALGVGSQSGVSSVSVDNKTDPANPVNKQVNTGDGAVAVGAAALSYSESSIAIGIKSVAGKTKKIADPYNTDPTKTILVADDTTTKAVAIGYDVVASNESALAIGTGARATGKNSISIGTGNIVSGNNSGAIGDPSINDANNSYSVGNNNAIGTGSDGSFILGSFNNIGATAVRDATTGVIDDTQPLTVTTPVTDAFILGGEVTATVNNSVYLGKGAHATIGSGKTKKSDGTFGTGATAPSTAGDGSYTNAMINGNSFGGTSGFAGASPTGLVSVGASGTERRIQNVAAGEISATSTDAINGSQLYSVAKAVVGSTYFHTHDGTARTYDNTEDNKDAINQPAGAFGENSLAAGVRTHAIGENATAVGYRSKAHSLNSVALGSQAEAKGNHSFAQGTAAKTYTDNSIAIGNTSVAGDATDASQKNAVAIGYEAHATKHDTTALGSDAKATADRATAVGYSADATGDSASAFGRDAQAVGKSSLALGQNAIAGKEDTSTTPSTRTLGSTSVGSYSRAFEEGATSVGYGALSYTENATAIGRGATVGSDTDTTTAKAGTAIGQAAETTVASGVALGHNSVADRGVLTSPTTSGSQITGIVAGGASKTVYAISSADTTAKTAITNTVKGTLGAVSVGTSTATRQIINVAAGSEDTDAVNVAQLRAVATAADRENYFHTNATGAGIDFSSLTADQQKNLDDVDGTGAALGVNSLAAGVEAKAGKGPETTAIGYKAEAHGYGDAHGHSTAVGANSYANIYSTAIGHTALAKHSRSTAIGYNSLADNTYTIAMGVGSKAKASQSTAIGFGATAETGAYRAVAVGTSAKVTHEGASAFGNGADALNKQATALGHSTTASGKYSTAVGGQVTTNLEGATAIGHGSRALVVDGSALGRDSQVLSTSGGGVALGSWSEAKRAATTAGAATSATPTVGTEVYAHGAATTADKAAISSTVTGTSGAVSVGTPGHFDRNGNMVDRRTRQITNLAAGAADTDAVNVAQLKAVANTGFNITADDTSGLTAPATSDNVGLGQTVTYTGREGGVQTKVVNNEIQFAVGTDNKTTEITYVDASGNPVTRTVTGGVVTYADSTGNIVPAAEVTSRVSATGALTVAGNKNLDTDAETLAGKTYSAGDGTQQQLGEELKIIGSTAAVTGVAADATGNATTGAYSAKNVQTVVTDGQVQIQLAENPEFTSVKAGTVNATTSVTIGDATDPTKSTTLTNAGDGLSVGGDKVTNIAQGEISTNSKDAVRGDQIKAIIDGGFKINADNGSVDTVALGDTVKYTSGSGNIVTTVTDNQIDFELKDNITIGAASSANSNTAATNPITINSTTGKITGLTDTLPDISNTSTSGTAPASVTQGTVATVDDVLNSGWNLQEDGVAKDFVKAYDTVNFADTDTATVTIDSTTTPGTSKITVDVQTVGLTTGTDGKTTVPTSLADQKKLVNAKDVAEAINASGFTLKTSASAGGEKDAGSTADELITPGKEVTIDAGKNIKVTQATNGKVTLATKDDVTFTTVKGLSNTGAIDLTTAPTGGQAATQEQVYQTITNNPITFAGNKGTNITKKLGETLNIEGGLANAAAASSSNVRVDSESGKLVVKIADAPTFTGQVTAPKFVTSGANAVTVDGTSGTITGLTNTTITSLDDGSSGTSVAATEAQLKQVNDTANAGFEIAANGDNGTPNKTIKPNDTLKVQGTGTGAFTTYDATNIQTQVSADDTITIGLKKDLVVDSVKAGDTTLNDNGVTIANGSTGGATVSLTKGGLNNGGNQITNVASGGSITNNADHTNAANMGDLKTVNDALIAKGIEVGANVGATQTHKLGNEVEIIGSTTLTTANASSANVMTEVSQDGSGKTTVEVKLANAPTFTGKVSAQGFDAGDEQITNVASGGALSSTNDNAANIADIYNATTALTNTGFGVNADNNSLQTHKLGKELAITAGNATGATSSGNLKTVVSQDASSGKTTVAISMKETPAFTQVELGSKAAISTTSTGAVRGDQIKAITDSIGTALGSSTTVNADGTITTANVGGTGKDTVHDAIEHVNKGFNLTTTSSTGGQVSGSITDQIQPTETLTVDAGQNIKVTQSANKISIATVERPQFGNTVINAAADGSKPAGRITGVTAGVDDTDVVNVGQLNAVKNSPITFSGNKGTDVTRKLGETLKVQGGLGNAAAASSANVRVDSDGTDTLTIKLADAPTFTGKVSAQGFDAGDEQITNVASGGALSSTNDNAANIADIYNATSALTNTGFDVGANKGAIVPATNSVTHKLGKQLDIVGSSTLADADASDKNVMTTVKTDAGTGLTTVSVQMADKPSFESSIDDGNATTTFVQDLANAADNTKVVNVGDLKGLAGTPMTFAGNNSTNVGAAGETNTVKRKLGEAITIKGGLTDVTKTSSDSNIRTVVNTGDNSISVQIADAPTFAGKVTAKGFDATGNKVENVAAGDINATSTDAVNGSQIHNIASKNATNVFGGNATVNPDGSTSFTDVGGTGANTIHDAIKSINTTASAGFTIAGKAPTTASDAIIKPSDTLSIVGANTNTDFSQSDAGKNIYTVVDADNTVRIGLANDLDVTSVKAQTMNATSSMTIGDATDPAKSTTLTSGANGLDVGGDKITNVAAGDINAASTDAVNGSQIHNIASKNATNVFGGNATVNPDGSTSFTDVGGTGANTIHDAIKAVNAEAGKRNTVSAGDNIVVTPVTTNGKTDYKVATAKDVTFDSVKAGPVTINNAGINAGDKQVAGVASGLVDANGNPVTIANATGDTLTNAANIGDLQKVQAGLGNTYQVIGGQSTGGGAVDGDGKVLKDKNGNKISAQVAIKTYSVEGREEKQNNTVISAIKSMNEGGIKYFHTNDTANQYSTGQTNSDDSSAGGGHSTAVGFRAKTEGAKSVALGNETFAKGDSSVSVGNSTVATGASSVAIGDGSKATGSQSIAIGTGNEVTGNNSGAIGDPNVISGSGSYALGNNNTIAANNSFVMGNDVKVAKGVDNAVAVGNKAKVTTKGSVALGAGSEAGKAHTGRYTVGGVYDAQVAAKPKANTQVVSVGRKGAERQVQNVAAGVVDKTSTDAINGSQLYLTNKAIEGLGNTILDNQDQANAGIAGAMAMASMPQAFIPGKSMLSGGIATYEGQGSVAIGMSRISDNGRWIYKFNGSADTQGNAGAAVGAGFHW